MSKLLEGRWSAAIMAKDVTPYDLRVGVTGHRELPLDQVPAIEAAVGRVLDQIERVLVEGSARPRVAGDQAPGTLRDLPGWLGGRIDSGVTAILRLVWRAVPQVARDVPPELQTPFRWIVVSPLAKGADRIVARAVLTRRPSPLDPEQVPPRLEVVLPMPLDKYREDFKDAEDRDEFEQLFARAVWSNAADEYLPTDVTHGQPRNTAYRLAGHAVANRCDMVIAIWDGQPPDGAGGTSDIVSYAVQQGRPVLWINSQSPETPVVLLTKTRLPSAKPWTDDAWPIGKQPIYIDDFPTRAKGLSLGFHRLAAFHRDTAVDPLQYDKRLAAGREELASTLGRFGLDPAAGIIGQTILPPLVRADMLAQRYQLLYRWAVMLIYVLALAAVTVAVAQQVFWPERHWIVVLEVLALLAAWGLLRVNRRERWQEKYLNDRYLAEWLRRAQFIALISSSNGPETASGAGPQAAPLAGQLVLYHGPETWFLDAFGRVIGEAVRQIHEGDAELPRAVTPLATLRQVVVEGWIEPQAAWHSAKARARERYAELGRRATFLLFALTLLMAVGHWLIGHHLPGVSARWVTLLVIVLPAAAAALHAIERIMDHERNADRSEQMARQLRRLADRLRAAETSDELRGAVRDVDALMAQEVEDWWASGTLQRPTHPV